MKRTPLARKTPMNRGKGMRGQRIAVAAVDEVRVLDLAAAAKALGHQQASAAVPREHAPVPEVSKPARRPSSTGFPAGVRTIILDRDGYACARCGIPVDTSSVGYSLQHRDNRGMGGTDDPAINRPANGIVLCGSGTTGCHGWTEEHPIAAARHGFAVESWAASTSVPVRYPHGWFSLDNHGSKWACSPPLDNDAHQCATRKDRP